MRTDSTVSKKLPPKEEELLGSIEYWLSIRGTSSLGKHIQYTTVEKIPGALWPWVVAKASFISYKWHKTTPTLQATAATVFLIPQTKQHGGGH
jgi:hypothetical protein